MSEKTIAAVATALSNSGIAIIRVSGNEAVDIADKIFVAHSGKKLSECVSHTINYGYVTDMSGNTIDEVLVSVMKGPHSYTGEDVVEINTHGGVVVTKKVLNELLNAGASMAEPGEFSKRAFLNGRMDLSQAEAVMDIIEAENNIAVKAGVSQLKGDIADEISKIRKVLLDDISQIEAANDDPEHIIYDVFDFELDKHIDYALDRLEILIQSFSKGRIVRNGLNTVILGKPNAGKSSLMNKMLGTDRAIVTEVAGTTRDSLEEGLDLGDVTLNLIDTAGIRNTDDVVESIGVDRSKKLAADADLILYVVDSSVKPDNSDSDILDTTVGKKMIVIYNKTDLNPETTVEELCKLISDHGHATEDFCILPASVRDNFGIEDISEKICELYDIGKIKNSNEIMLTNLRHKEAIDKAVISLKNVQKGILDRVPEDMLTIDLMDAYTSLGAVIGEDVDEDLIDNIFSRFCLGK